MDTIHFIAVCILGLLGIYGAAALRESARDHAQEIRKALPIRPSVPMVSVYGLETSERRAWPVHPMSTLGMPKHEWRIMARRVREYHARLQ